MKEHRPTCGTDFIICAYTHEEREIKLRMIITYMLPLRIGVARSHVPYVFVRAKTGYIRKSIECASDAYTTCRQKISRRLQVQGGRHPQRMTRSMHMYKMPAPPQHPVNGQTVV